MNLKKFISNLAVLVAVIGIAGTTVAMTSAQTVEETPSGEVQQEGRRGNRGNGQSAEWFDQDLYSQTMANELGTTVEALEAAKEADTSLTDVLGVTSEEVSAAKQVAKQAVIDQAVANGDITAEEAEALANRQGKRGGHAKPEWYDADLAQATFANELGTTVEALEAIKESGDALTDALGVTSEEISAAKQVAKQAVIDQAVANGDITAEEAEAFSNGEGRQGRGNGTRGQRGGDNAPIVETNA